MRIFVSYRREDSAGWAGRLVSDLAGRVGVANVFQDIQSIEPGADFAEVILKTLQSTDCVLVVIGPAWLAKDPAGNRRLDNVNDYVRLEVATALQSSSRVIPVLVGGAVMPAIAALPDDIRGLARRNAIELTDRRWSYDVDQLLDKLHGKAVYPLLRRLRWRWIAAGSASIVFLVMLIYFALPGTPPELIPARLESCKANDKVSNPASPGKSCTRFLDPRVRVYNRDIHLDGCRTYSSSCGSPLWNWYCAHWGFPRALGAEVVDIGETYIFGDGRWVPSSHVPTRAKPDDVGLCKRNSQVRCGGPTYVDCGE